MTIEKVVAACLSETEGMARSAGTSVAVAGIGTTAEHALRGDLLRAAFDTRGVTIAATHPFSHADALLTSTEWDLALVLSPWKQSVPARLHRTTSSAQATGVVDTILRGPELIGVNTNTWAAQGAMETLVGARVPTNILILGAGASAYSVALACKRVWPNSRLWGSARNSDGLSAWGAHFDATCVAPERLKELGGADREGLIINTTTWGETEESEKQTFAFDLDSLLLPGNQLFDLNNRTSLLQQAGLRAGMSVMSGTFMQRATNACRAALAKGMKP